MDDNAAAAWRELTDTMDAAELSILADAISARCYAWLALLTTDQLLDVKLAVSAHLAALETAAA
jgi:hypothetical protein